MSTVGVLPHASKPQARALAPDVVRWLQERDHDVCLTERDAADLGFAGLAGDAGRFAALDLLVVLGGDGTMLHGVELAGLAGVPLLGVNLGVLGFLTEVQADGVYEALERTLAGDRTIDERSTVRGMLTRGTGEVVDLGEGVNEVSVERTVGGKVIRMALTIGGQPFTAFGADGAIVATPTGSTAYAFSMRGPVVSPELRSLIVVAVGAHSLFDRPLVIADGMDVEVEVRDRGTGVIVIDGVPKTEIAGGDVLRASVGPSTVRLVRLGPSSDFTRVAQKFGLPPAGP